MKFNISSPDMMDAAAQALIDSLHSRTVVAFYGQMGAGKTTFIKAICRQMGVDDNVTSPTFAIVNEYNISETNNPIYHFDFYRIKNPQEADDIGCDEYFYSGNLCLIEWPEIIENQLPDDTLNVNITIENNQTRTISWEE